MIIIKPRITSLFKNKERLVSQLLIIFLLIASILPLTLQASSIQSDPLENWHWRNPYPTGNDLECFL